MGGNWHSLCQLIDATHEKMNVLFHEDICAKIQAVKHLSDVSQGQKIMNSINLLLLDIFSQVQHECSCQWRHSHNDRNFLKDTPVRETGLLETKVIHQAYACKTIPTYSADEYDDCENIFMASSVRRNALTDNEP